MRSPGSACSAAFTSPIDFVNVYESSVWREFARSAVPHHTCGPEPRVAIGNRPQALPFPMRGGAESCEERICGARRASICRFCFALNTPSSAAFCAARKSCCGGARGELRE